MTMSPSPPPNDEVSLREAYLVVRRRAPLIAAFVAVVALLVLVVSILRPPVYQAEATTAVSRAPISVQQEGGVGFRPELDVTYETYETLAFTRGVLERVLAARPDADLSLAGAREAFSLERLAGAANQPSSLLAVAHRVRHADPGVAAELATAWAASTIETVRGLLNENLDAIERITIDGVETASLALDQAEEALRELRDAQDASTDPQRLASAQARLGDIEARSDVIAQRIRGHEAEAAEFAARVAEGSDELVVLSNSNEVALTVTGALWAVEAHLAALRAEQEVVEAQRSALTEQIAVLAPSVARFESGIERRARALDHARRAHDTLVSIEPTVAYVAQLAPTGARVLGEAAVPTRPESRNTLLTVALAGIAAAFAAIVLVLLAEAVREPAPATSSGGAAQRRERPPG